MQPTYQGLTKICIFVRKQITFYIFFFKVFLYYLFQVSFMFLHTKYKDPYNVHKNTLDSTNFTRTDFRHWQFNKIGSLSFFGLPILFRKGNLCFFSLNLFLKILTFLCTISAILKEVQGNSRKGFGRCRLSCFYAEG